MRSRVGVAGAVVATDFVSVNADYDNGIATLRGSSWPGWHDGPAYRQLAGAQDSRRGRILASHP
jgi:hypothetical protein